MNLEQIVRTFLVAIGLITLGSAIGIIVDPTLAAGVPFGAGTVTAIGAIAAGLGLWLVRSRYRGDQVATQMPIPELPPARSIPGDDVDKLLEDFTERRRGTIEYRERIEERLRETAIAIIAQREDCSTETATEYLESGVWTDNEVAATFFGASVNASSSIGDRILGTISGNDDYRYRIEETVNAILTKAALSTDDETDNSADEATDDATDSGIFDHLRNRFDGGDDGRRASWNLDSSSFDSFDVEPGIHVAATESTGHWHSVSAFGLIAFGIGVFVPQAGLMVAGAIAVGFAAYAQIAPSASMTDLTISRDLSTDQPDIGDEVKVTVTVENTGNTIIPDLRLVDVVPDALALVQGSPRLGTALRPETTVTFSYTVVAQRGKYEWPVAAVARDVSGQRETAGLLAPEATLFCVPSLQTTSSMPVRPQTSQLSGNVNTATGGVGLEFYSQREYQTGDAMKRVNWKRLARTGDLATVEYREEKAATITLLFDARDSAYQSPKLGDPHALDRSVTAACDVFASLYDDGDLVGVAAFDTVPCWLSPNSGSEHLEQARMLFATHPALSSSPPDRLGLEGTYVDPMTHVRRQLPTNSQIMLFSPLNDDYAIEVAKRLDSAGHLVTIISPDTTATGTIGRQLAKVERTLRVTTLRERGIRVIDWEPDEELTLAIIKAQKRWSA